MERTGTLIITAV